MENLIKIYGVSLAPLVVTEKLASIQMDIINSKVIIERLYKDSDDAFAPPKTHISYITEGNKGDLDFHLAQEDVDRIKVNLGW